MERIEQLINKLAEQKDKGQSPAQLLITVQLLHAELAAAVRKSSVKNTSKVAVLMPIHVAREQVDAGEERVQMPASPVFKKEPQSTTLVSIPEKDKRFIPAETPAVEDKLPEPEIKAEDNEQERKIPVLSYTVPKPVLKVIEKAPVEHEPKELFSLSLDGLHEAPTLMQHTVAEKEVHELIAEKNESLNDKLKQEQLELGNTLKEAPIKDLRKGIGVNDKFLFINELFRGDDAMYERSIKTINGFRILPEAEYWMNRELKVKLGWNDSKETVQLFYAVVRRRFS